MSTFYHSGKLGDIIYSLPTVMRLAGDGTIGAAFVSGMTRRETELIRPMLELQPYIKVIYHHTDGTLPPGFINLDRFRHHPQLGKKHLVLVHGEAQDVQIRPGWERGWLIIPRMLHALSKENYAIISVTERYRDPLFNWKWEINWLRRKVDKIYFMGFPEEYNRSPFAESKYVRYLKSYNLMEAAAYITGARYFSGNQSAALAIRQGAGLSYRFEQSPNHWDVRQDSEHETVINRVTRRIFLTALCIKKALQGKQA